MNILITGVAGFIGSKLCYELLKDKKNKVYGIDNLSSYYSIKLKKLRLKNLKKFKNFKFYKQDIKDMNKLEKINFKKIDIIYHFAAQAGVRYVLSDPKKYFDDNIKVFFNILNLIKIKKVRKLFFASSSSVYGDQKKYPLNEKVDLKEKNFYGFSKRMNEYSAKIFSNIYNTEIIGLRFFTVFGEWGRPDMLIFKYLKANYSHEKFVLNESGSHKRDFTYIDDVVKILFKMRNFKFSKKFSLINICSNKPVKVISVINKINKFNKNFSYISRSSKLLKKIEVKVTHGDNAKVKNYFKKFKFTNFDKALKKTVQWYIDKKIYKIT